MTGNELIEIYESPEMIWNKNEKIPRNSMGCSEYWYYPEYSICKTFTEEELRNMSEKEINNLMKLAEKISEGLY